MRSENDMNIESEDVSSNEFENTKIHDSISEGIPSDLPPSQEGSKGDSKKETSLFFSEFLQKLENEPTVDGKIRLSIDFMRDALSYPGTPRFKDFWEGRKICLPLFKENITPKIRSQLWNSYIELSNEAKRLKEILDEQSAFAIEQIELAILALERELENYDLLLSQSPEPDLLNSMTLKEKRNFYYPLQKELQLLNTLAARINALRKEVVKTEMRIRIKNKLLERLSHCGDQIFPKRKELIKKVSQEFMNDVDTFIADYFQDEECKDVPLYTLREEIKQLQAIAKVLTLNTHAFTETRLKLSQCWDKIKTQEKERKKQTQVKRQTFKKNFDLVMEKIKPFAEACTGEMTIEECNRRSAEILDWMRTFELGREEIKLLKEEIYKAKRVLLDHAREAEAERRKREQEMEALRREKINHLKEDLNTVIAHASTFEIDTLLEKQETLYKQFEEMSLTKAERQMMERSLKQLKDVIDEQREKALLQLSEDDLKALSQLKAVLEERKSRRQEIKNQLEHYRKLLGGSGFDFEKAMMYREHIEAEKASLEKINSSIEEIEEKISEIEG